MAYILSYLGTLTKMSPQISIVMNYEAAKRWILAEKQLFFENFSFFSD